MKDEEEENELFISFYARNFIFGTEVTFLLPNLPIMIFFHSFTWSKIQPL